MLPATTRLLKRRCTSTKLLQSRRLFAHRWMSSQAVVSAPASSPSPPHDHEEHGGYRATFTSSQYRHHLSLIEACVRTGQIKRAELMMERVWGMYPVLSRQWMSVHVYNLLLSGFVDGQHQQQPQRVMMREMVDWLRRMKERGVMPNRGTYALMIYGALMYRRQGSSRVDFAKVLVDEYKRAEAAIDRDLNADPLLAALVDAGRRLLGEGRFADIEPELQALFTGDKKATNVRAQSSITDTSPLPSVRAVDSSKLRDVQHNLDILHTDSSSSPTLFDLQIQMEQESFRINQKHLAERDATVKQTTGFGYLPTDVKRLAGRWHNALTERLRKEISTTLRSQSGFLDDSNDYATFLLFFERHPEQLSLSTLTQFIKYSVDSPDECRSAHVVNAIGESVEHSYRYLLMKNKDVRKQLSIDYEQAQALVKSRRLFDARIRRLKAKEHDTDGVGALLSSGQWESETRMRIGSYLAGVFMEVAKVPVDAQSNSVRFSSDAERNLLPAFEHGHLPLNGKQIGVFRPHSALIKTFDVPPLDSDLNSARPRQGVALPKLLPMIVPPKPWIHYQSGGYLTTRTYCMRGLTKETELLLRQGSLNGQLSQVFSGLDALGMTRWRINERMLEHMIHAWNCGLTIAKLPADLPEQVELPPKPEDYETSMESRLAYHRELKEVKRLYGDLKSQRSTENYKLEIARSFIGKTMYFPHNLDFRGRAYPIPPLFNHIGNDLARALLLFDRAKPLGDDGLRWLKIHLANAYGNDKATFEERAAFIDENMDKVMASADDPFNASDPDRHQWWLKADKPWMCLATAMEVVAAVRSGDPSTFMSHLPVHQDGSCNGLQHYAALGGDFAGATQVNLAAGLERPQDVYSAAADIVREQVRRDLAIPQQPEWSSVADADVSSRINELNRLGQFDSDECRHLLARLLTPERVERKTVKQTVMTSVYGVTYIGARDQIMSRFKEKYVPHVYSKDEAYFLARYLTPKVFDALNNMFQGARRIQDWLAEGARQISYSVPVEELERVQRELPPGRRQQQALLTHRRACVTWTTPLGLTVVQPYRKSKSYSISTALQTFTLKAQSSDTPVDAQRQIAGFPPNFIHSLDATHMLMTANECAKQEDPIDFAAVHDSYWTHPSDIQRLRKLLKEQFVALHSQPIMKNLERELHERFGSRRILNVYTREQWEKRQQQEQQKQELQENDGDKASTTTTITATKSSQIVQAWEPISLPALPPRGDFDVKEVLQSEYFFS